MNILMILLVAVEAVLGLGSSLGIVLVLAGTVAFKIYRKVKFGVSLYD